MLIGYSRFNSEIELDLANGSVNTLGTEYRTSILHAWKVQNIDFTLLTKIKKKDLALFNQSTLFDAPKTFPFNQSIRYEPTELPNIDALFMECGSTNTLFNQGEILRRVAQLIKNHRGNVIYYEHDATLPFPFEVFNMDYRHDLSPLNLGNIFSGVDVWEGKKWTHLSHIHPEKVDTLIDKKSGVRYDYKKYKDRITWKTIPLCYSEIEPFYESKVEPKYDVVYVGSERDKNRRKKLLKFIDVPNGIVIGKWEAKNTKVFKSLRFVGQQGKQGACYGYYNDAYLSMLVSDKIYEELGHMQHRPIEIIRGGAVALADVDIFGVERYFDSEFIVSEKKEVEDWILYLKECGVDERKKIQTKQLSRFKEWKDLDWKDILT